MSNNNSIFSEQQIEIAKTVPCMGNFLKRHLNLKNNGLYSPNKIPFLRWGWRGEQLSLCKLDANTNAVTVQWQNKHSTKFRRIY